MRGYGSIETQPEFEGMESERSPLKGIKIDIPNADAETSTGSNNSKHILVSLAAVSFLIFGTFALHHNLEGASLFGQIKDEDKPRFYNNQLIDHNDVDSSTYAQKYYEKTDLFGGPGHPIFVILGGEDAVDQILYPYISQIVAEAFSGFTICSCGMHDIHAECLDRVLDRCLLQKDTGTSFEYQWTFLTNA